MQQYVHCLTSDGSSPAGPGNLLLALWGGCLVTAGGHASPPGVHTIAVGCLDSGVLKQLGVDERDR